MHLPPRWVVVVSAAVAAAILGDSLLYAVLPTVWPELGLDVGMVGVLLSANRFVRILSNPVAGWVMARAGVRGPFVGAVFVAALTTWVYGAGLGFAALLAARAVWGVCWSFLRLGGYLAALEVANDQTRGFYLGFFNGVTRFGSFIATLLGGLLTDLVGFHATILAFTGATVAGGLATLREKPPHHTPPPDSERDAGPGAAPVSSALRGAETAAPAPSAPVVTMRPLWMLYALVFLHGLAISGLVTATLGLWLRNLYGPSVQAGAFMIGIATVSGTLLSLRFLGDFLWGPYAGHLSDRYGRRRIILLAGAVQIGALIGLSATTSLWGTLIAAVCLFGAAPALQVSLDAQTGSLVPPEQRAQTMSWYATWLDLGAAVGPLVGYLLGIGVGLEWMYRGSAGLLLLAGIAYCVVFRRRAPAPATD